MREKYVEESYPRWFIFGEYADGVHVDVASAGQDVVTHVTRAEAERLITDRNRTIDQLCKVALAFAAAAPEKFTECWYGGKS